MGRQIQINATVNDIRMLIESVKKEFPTICRLDRKGRTIEPSYDLYNTNNYFGSTFYITTDEIYQTVKKITEDDNRENPTFIHAHIAVFLDQCVEIRPSIHIYTEKNMITGSIDPARRIYINAARMEAVDRLYSCFIKHTRRSTTKYKHKNPKINYLLYSFPEADRILKDYLMNKGEKNDSIRLIIPDGFEDDYSVV